MLRLPGDSVPSRLARGLPRFHLQPSKARLRLEERTRNNGRSAWIPRRLMVLGGHARLAETSLDWHESGGRRILYRAANAEKRPCMKVGWGR